MPSYDNIIRLYQERVRQLIQMGMEEGLAIQYVQDTFYMLTLIHLEQMQTYDIELVDTPVMASEHFESENMIILIDKDEV